MACFSAIDNCGFQVNRLDCDGNILNGAEDVVVTCSVTDFSYEPIRGESRTTNDPNGRGGYCAERIDEGSIEGYEITLTLCSKTDPALMELLGLGQRVINADGDTVGFQPNDPADNCDCQTPPDGCSDPGVAIMFWHLAWCDKERLADLPFAISAFPKIVWDEGFSVTRNNEFNTYELTGRAYLNEQWGQGPGSVYPNAAGLQTFYSEFATAVPFPGGCDCALCGFATADFLGV